ncbi:MAG: A24 family peptidase [Planctomycetes bacterium]|nr:A24 family peptidase [Planctomycetota bacterium]
MASLAIIPVLIIGACVGSFLNVVIYRLPIGLSISRPRWSFCPTCEKQIAPHYNIPILGWLMLGGRCRDCHSPISMMYPVIEAATAILFVLIWDAVLVAKVFPGCHGTLAGDWPMVIAALFLFAGLLAGSAMDIETYTIHIQIPILTVAIAVVAHGIRGLPMEAVATGGASQSSMSSVMLPPALCAIGLAMGVGWLVSLPFQKGEPTPTTDQPVDEGTTPNPEGASESPGTIEASPKNTVAEWRFQPVPVLLLTGLALGLAAWQSLAATMGLPIAITPGGQRAILGTAVFLLILILASLENRESDTQIIEDLERERPLARAMASREFVSLLPALVAGIGVLVWLRYTGRVGVEWDSIVTPSGTPGSTGSGILVHVAGGLHALSAAILAAAVGWTVRILGTWAFGKEAFGSGDIFIMASIGAVGGLWLVIIGFLFSAILALVGVLATSFKKTSRAIPFGPWLALGAFVSLWLLGPVTMFFGPLGWFLWAVISGQPSHGFGG